MTPSELPLEAPPLEAVRALIDALERAGVRCALGGSGLLAAFGLASVVRDWDFTTDAPRERLLAALEGRSAEHKGSDAIHADEKFMLPELRLEIIRGFAFVTSRGPIHIPTRVTRRWRGVPVGSPEGWAVAYALLGRDEKSERLFEWLARHGADPASVRPLIAQPLPELLAQRLAALPLAAR